MSMETLDTACGEGERRLALRDIPLSSPYFRKQAYAFLERAGLQPPARLDSMAGIYDEEEERLLACCGLDGSTVKCLAVAPEARRLNLAARLVAYQTDRACRMGHDNVTVFTKPANEELFRQMGFSLVGRAAGAIMLESDPRALPRYAAYLRSLRRPGKCGAVVMNGNPLTRGHLYLIEEARRRADHLYVILVADNPLTFFSYADRREMLARTVCGMENVTLVEGSIYSVSAATFPSYFIKTKTQATEAHIALDLDIFGRHLAPALGATLRFVGEEPLDPLTAAYNAGMHRLLPGYGVEVVEIPRCRVSGMDSPFICATRVRESLAAGRSAEALRLGTPAAAPYLLAKAAVQALQDELDLTPKPGLVDRNNNGAHRDMDYALMQRSIRALEPAFKQVALRACGPQPPAAADLQRIGREGEERMLRETGGVNTHKGALFALGLTTAAAARLLAAGKPLEPQALQREVAHVATGFAQPAGTHGAEVCRRYKANGALANALTGYAPLFADWLPYYRSQAGRPDAPYRLLLRIMATLDDTNVLHRAGPETAHAVKRQAQELLADFSPEKLERLDRDFISRNLSPGGAADMFALTRFVAGLCGTPGDEE